MAHDEDVWLEYLSARRESYLNERRRLLGPEYAMDPQRWDSLLEQEWIVMRDRLAAGHDIEDPVKRQLGEDFFERQLMEQLESEVHQVASDFEEIQWQDKLLPFVYYEDFIMLAQQGIFRLEEFIPAGELELTVCTTTTRATNRGARLKNLFLEWGC